MKVAIAESIAEKLEEQNDVLGTDIDGSQDEPSVTAYVPNRHAESRVKRTLHEFPMYVDLVIVDPEGYNA